MTKPYYQHWPQLLPKELYYPQVPLFVLLETSARFYPDKTAINFYGREISYSQLQESILHLAGALAEMGVSKGSRVAVYMQDTPQFVISYYAIMRANAVVVPLNPMLVEAELEFLVKDSGSEIVITTADLMPRILNIKPNTALKEVIVSQYQDYLPEKASLPVPSSLLADYPVIEGVKKLQELISKELPAPLVEVGPEDLCMLPYTSGSTGNPKGCMHTHATVISNTVSAYYWMVHTSATVTLAVLPFFHVTGLIHSLLSPLYAGSTIIMLARWDRKTALQAIEQMRCTHWVNISTMLVDLLAAPDIEQRDLSSLMGIGGGGAPLPRAVGEKLEQLTGLKYVEGYGLTETISQTHFNPPHRPKLQCIGIPDFGVDARIIDVDSGKEVPPGKEGELIISGPEVFKGYWNRPEDNENAFMEIEGKAFFKTGDVCYMDEEGYFFIVDRTKRMINAAGFKVWPAEVENHLYKNPHILEACVVGVPDTKRVEEVRAYVVLKEASRGQVTKEDIINWSKQRMSAYKYPRQVRFVDSLPKSASGKILWRQMETEAKKEFA
ncbi:AMP-binding protein [Metallumcola ferriviriculae]|uniref:AMP-binding protein n=1 Tax=Metallumcola ferriviriculae TaxID=3039180 RepID=A0AAU0UN76_9FIRM|nr:AMP-binding protein [Desulfitibacteraceae bacterium MK1]